MIPPEVREAASVIAECLWASSTHTHRTHTCEAACCARKARARTKVEGEVEIPGFDLSSVVVVERGAGVLQDGPLALTRAPSIKEASWGRTVSDRGAKGMVDEDAPWLKISYEPCPGAALKSPVTITAASSCARSLSTVLTSTRAPACGYQARLLKEDERY